MHGNVWEWCQDCYGAYDAKQTVDPTGAANGEYRVVRGGSWGNQARSARSAIRGGNRPAYRDHNVGFRLVLR
jgi:formylglycine-generating enzyme required for sulfatase activity